jgi:hypothetical protein
MADNSTKRGKPDRTRVNIHEPFEVAYWCAKWGCSEAELLSAAQSTGVAVDDVEARLIVRGHKRK